jgi:hypothetical protein
MTELLAFIQAVGVPGAIALVLVCHIGPKLDKLTLAILSIGTRLTICPLIKPANPAEKHSTQ